MANDIGPSALVVGCTDETFGYMESMEVSEAVEESNARNGAGDIVAANFYGKVKTMTATMIWRTATGNWSAQVGTGTAISVSDSDIGSGDWYVTEASQAKAQGDYFRQTITAKQYPDLAS